MPQLYTGNGPTLQSFWELRDSKLSHSQQTILRKGPHDTRSFLTITPKHSKSSLMNQPLPFQRLFESLVGYLPSELPFLMGSTYQIK